MKNKIYSKIDSIPKGRASDKITRGCLVLEGGGWKGLYTVGVLDCLMLNDINLSSVVGVSAGALSAIGYLSGQIGWGARIDLTYRHDPNYCGVGAMRRDHGITGFSYLFNELLEKHPVDMERLMDPGRKFAVSATDIDTGNTTYFEKGKCDLFKAVQASATVPYVSLPVEVNGRYYLDGGCSENIPLGWVKRSGENKVVVVKTFADTGNTFNKRVEELSKKSKEKKVFVIEPSEEVTVTRFEGDMEKLGELYWLGFNDTKKRIGPLKDYLAR